MQIEPEPTCANCGSTGLDRFCPRCGQETPGPEDFKVRHFLAEIFSSITSFEGRFFRTVVTLVAHPGWLTKDYFDGRRQRYLKPVQLFVVCNLIYFLTRNRCST